MYLQAYILCIFTLIEFHSAYPLGAGGCVQELCHHSTPGLTREQILCQTDKILFIHILYPFLLGIHVSITVNEWLSKKLQNYKTCNLYVIIS